MAQIAVWAGACNNVIRIGIRLGIGVRTLGCAAMSDVFCVIDGYCAWAE